MATHSYFCTSALNNLQHSSHFQYLKLQKGQLEFESPAAHDYSLRDLAVFVPSGLLSAALTFSVALTPDVSALTFAVLALTFAQVTSSELTTLAQSRWRAL